MFQKLLITICLFLFFSFSNLSAQKRVISGYLGKKSFIGLKYHTMVAAFPTPRGDNWQINGEYLNNSTLPLTHQVGLEFGKTFTRSLNLYLAVKTTRLGSETAIINMPNSGGDGERSNAFVSFRSLVVQLGIDFKGGKYWSMPPMGKYAGFHLYYAKALEPDYLFVRDPRSSTFTMFEDCDCTTELTADNQTNGFGLTFVSGYRKPLSKSGFYYNIGASLSVPFDFGSSERLIMRVHQSQFFAIDLSVGKLF